MELEVTWGRAVRVWWALFWRNLVAIAAGMVIGGILGGIIGFVMGMAGADAKTIQTVTLPIGVALGLAISVIPIKLILGKDFGEFRLLLMPRKP